MGGSSFTGRELEARICCRCFRSDTSVGQSMMLACRGGSLSYSTRRPASSTADSLSSPQPWSRCAVGCFPTTFMPRLHMSVQPRSSIRNTESSSFLFGSNSLGFTMESVRRLPSTANLASDPVTLTVICLEIHATVQNSSSRIAAECQSTVHGRSIVRHEKVRRMLFPRKDKC